MANIKIDDRDERMRWEEYQGQQVAYEKQTHWLTLSSLHLLLLHLPMPCFLLLLLLLSHLRILGVPLLQHLGLYWLSLLAASWSGTKIMYPKELFWKGPFACVPFVLLPLCRPSPAKGSLKVQGWSYAPALFLLLSPRLPWPFANSGLVFLGILGILLEKKRSVKV